MAALAAALGLERFALAGYSGGGPYALACAAALAGRVSTVAQASGLVPLDSPGALSGMSLANRVGLALVGRLPWPLLAPLVAPLLRRDPGPLWQLMVKSAPLADRAILSRPEVRAICIASLREAYRAGPAGYLDDWSGLRRRWGFDPRAIQVPILIWHGDQDVQVPIDHARQLARAIPGARVVVLPGQGHYLFFERWAEILKALLAAAA